MLYAQKKFNEIGVRRPTTVHVAHVFLSLVRSLSFRHETKERNEQGVVLSQSIHTGSLKNRFYNMVLKGHNTLQIYKKFPY